MNSHAGCVVAVRAEHGVVVVRPDQPVACARCAAGRGCGAGLMSPETVGELTLPLDPEAAIPSVDDRVSLILPGGQLLRAAAIVYGWPLGAALAMSLAGSMLTQSDAVLAVLAVVGLALGFGIARWQASRRCLLPSLSQP